MEAVLNERYRMWCKLISGYSKLSPKEKRIAKRKYMNDNGMDPCKLSDIEPNDFFGCCEEKSDIPMKRKKESEMYVQIAPPNPTSEISEQRSYLRERAYTIRGEKATEIEIAFGLQDDKDPRTTNEFIQRIKDGKYIIAGNKGDQRTYYPLQNIRWRDPEKKEDQVGNDAALDKLSKAFEDLFDEINVKTPAEGLAAIRAFQSATFN